MTKFKRMNQHSVFGGICSGIAYSLGAPTWIFRLALFIMIFFYNVDIFGFSILFIYILIALFAPKYDSDPTDYKQVCA